MQVRYEVKITHAADGNIQLMCSLMLGSRASKGRNSYCLGLNFND
jgi:hypothetical protein